MQPDPYRRPIYPPLADITAPVVDTNHAAFYLCRRPDTLRLWACRDNGPLKPIRLHGRLAWPVSELRRLTKAELH